MAPTDSAIAARLRSQLLAGPPARDPLAVAERLLAIQGQDPVGARLAVRARSPGLHAADIDRELTERRSLLITWCNRGTLHLVRSEDYPWLHALTTPPLMTSSDTRLRQTGVSPAQLERGLALIRRTLAASGPQTRQALRERLERAGVPVAGQALIHVLYRASLLGICVRGPLIGREHAYALVRDWLPAPPAIDRGRALAELARRYLAGHGPASERDLARWAGLALREARAGMTAIAAELRPVAGDLVDLAHRRAGHEEDAEAAGFPTPRLLGAFDPLLLGWVSRAEVLGEHQERIVSGGVFRPFALVDGRAAASWTLPARGRGSAGGVREVAIEPFADLSPAALEALRDDARDVVRFLG